MLTQILVARLFELYRHVEYRASKRWDELPTADSTIVKRSIESDRC